MRERNLLRMAYVYFKSSCIRVHRALLWQIQPQDLFNTNTTCIPEPRSAGVSRKSAPGEVSITTVDTARSSSSAPSARETEGGGERVGPDWRREGGRARGWREGQGFISSSAPAAKSHERKVFAQKARQTQQCAITVDQRTSIELLYLNAGRCFRALLRICPKLPA